MGRARPGHEAAVAGLGLRCGPAFTRIEYARRPRLRLPAGRRVLAEVELAVGEARVLELAAQVGQGRPERLPAHLGATGQTHRLDLHV